MAYVWKVKSNVIGAYSGAITVSRGGENIFNYTRSNYVCEGFAMVALYWRIIVTEWPGTWHDVTATETRFMNKTAGGNVGIKLKSRS